MLHHRWQEAAEYMACYPQVLEDVTRDSMVQRKEVGLDRTLLDHFNTSRDEEHLSLSRQLIWRLGTEILHHHSKSKLEDYNNIYERMKHTGFKLYLMVR